MKRILCYGDSNTYGCDARRVPVDGTFSRFDEQTRWTCRLESLLGKDWRVLEAGLNGRTTVFDDPTGSDQNGFVTLDVAFRYADPVDYVVLMLGTNDLKDMFSASAAIITAGLQKLVLRLQQLIAGSLQPSARILILSPANVRRASNGIFYFDFSPRSVEKGAQLPKLYARLAQDTGCLFADAGQWVETDGADGVHLSPESHRVFAEKLCAVIRQAEQDGAAAP